MGNAYLLHQDEDAIVEIHEMSNNLNLFMASPDENEYGSFSTSALKPVEMLRLLLKGITVCSYWMSEEEFNKTMKELEAYPF